MNGPAQPATPAAPATPATPAPAAPAQPADPMLQGLSGEVQPIIPMPQPQSDVLDISLKKGIHRAQPAPQPQPQQQPQMMQPVPAPNQTSLASTFGVMPGAFDELMKPQ